VDLEIVPADGFQEWSDVVGGKLDLDLESGEDRNLEARRKLREDDPFGVICSEMNWCRGSRIRNVAGFEMHHVSGVQHGRVEPCEICDSVNKINLHRLHSPLCCLPWNQAMVKSMKS
jgi:hypothetical protein